MKKNTDIGVGKVGIYYVYLVLVWGMFRMLVKFPDLVEELWFKPIIWLLPLLLLMMGAKKRIRFFEGSFTKAAMWGAGLGVVFVAIAIVSGLGKYGSLVLVDIGNVGRLLDVAGIGLATAITEELVFSGFIFQTLMKKMKKLWLAMATTAVMLAVVYMPILMFFHKLSTNQMMGTLAVVIVIALGNYWIMNRTKNVMAPILSHWIWGMAIFIFG